MIARVRLQNYRAFGALQTAPLEPLTLLVGANNSGKSSFLRFAEVARQRRMPVRDVPADWWHRPAWGDEWMIVGWDVEPQASVPRVLTWEMTLGRQPPKLSERLVVDGETLLTNVWAGQGPHAAITTSGMSLGGFGPIVAFAFERPGKLQERLHAWIRSSIPSNSLATSICASTPSAWNGTIGPGAVIREDGSGLAALVAAWHLGEPEKLEQFTAIIRRCVPEIRRIFAPPLSQGTVRLQFEQVDGERFDATQVSDGLLVFAGFVAHAIQALPGTLFLVEEPERGVHPRRLGNLVELWRTLADERQTQFVMATHSPALLNLFRDTPEAILLFRRAATGTEIRPLSDVPTLADLLSRTDPGEMLVSGAFNESYELRSGRRRARCGGAPGMTLEVALASENNAYDAVLFGDLLTMLLGAPVRVWTGQFEFAGCKAVAKLAPAFLVAARLAGLRHALLAVDNDGGALRRPEHASAHVPVPFNIDDDDTCRECWLQQSLPASWGSNGEKTCIAVPVQAVETWLLCARGDNLSPSPEHVYYRSGLKKRFFGRGGLSAAKRLALARSELAKPGSLATLRARPSFQRFEARLSTWP